MIKTTIIGGELSSADIDLFKTDSEKGFEINFGKPSIFFQTGADAIAAALIIMNRREDISTLFVPEHFCHDTLLRVALKTKKEMSLKVVSYKSLSDLGQRKTGEVFFFVHFNFIA